MLILAAIATCGIAEIDAHAHEPPPCSPFSVHPKAIPHRVWQNVPTREGVAPPRLSEDAILDQLSTIRAYSAFVDAYKGGTSRSAMPAEERIAWLSCILFYAAQDTDGDRIPDWTALIDGIPSRVLYPLDEDLDGDGTANVWDPDPFDRRYRGESRADRFPDHLKDRRPEVAELQKVIYRDHGILAINHTDRHSPTVLRNLHFLLARGFPKGVRFSGFRYVYAFAGHDSKTNLAAYHPAAKAISIGGIESYTNESTGTAADLQIPILSTLAHEIGHAFLFRRMTASELRRIIVKFGDWAEVFAHAADPRPLSLLSPSFFKPRSGRQLAAAAMTASTVPMAPTSASRSPAEAPVSIDARKWNQISGYAATNIHEWFADAFAAAALRRLGESRLLGSNWRERLIVPPGIGRTRDYWVNYNHLSDEFRDWIVRKLRQRG